MSDRAERLVEDLHGLSEDSVRLLRAVVNDDSALDEDASRRVRAQIAAAGIGLNTQLRADALRLRAARQDMALERLIEVLREKELLVPTDAKREPSTALTSAVST